MSSNNVEEGGDVLMSDMENEDNLRPDMKSEDNLMWQGLCDREYNDVYDAVMSSIDDVQMFDVQSISKNATNQTNHDAKLLYSIFSRNASGTDAANSLKKRKRVPPKHAGSKDDMRCGAALKAWLSGSKYRHDYETSPRVVDNTTRADVLYNSNTDKLQTQALSVVASQEALKPGVCGRGKDVFDAMEVGDVCGDVSKTGGDHGDCVERKYLKAKRRCSRKEADQPEVSVSAGGDYGLDLKCEREL